MGDLDLTGISYSIPCRPNPGSPRFLPAFRPMLPHSDDIAADRDVADPLPQGHAGEPSDGFLGQQRVRVQVASSRPCFWVTLDLERRDQNMGPTWN
jgi:hypothetical protein